MIHLQKVNFEHFLILEQFLLKILTYYFEYNLFKILIKALAVYVINGYYQSL